MAAKKQSDPKKPKIQQMLTKVNFTDADRGSDRIKYLVKHYVGATGGAEANCRFFLDTYRGASAHYFVDHDGTIYQCVADADIAWHCGASAYKHKECRNSNSIGVELCVKKDKNGKWYYTSATKKSAVTLFAYLADKYDIAADHILRHYDVTGKICGEPDVRSGNKVWSQFLSDVAAQRKETVAALEAGTTTVQPAAGTAAQEKTQPDGVPYQIRTTCDVLRIRAGAGTTYRVIGSIRECVGLKLRYTIVEEKNGWGRLKSGGWIALAYTKRVE